MLETPILQGVNPDMLNYLSSNCKINHLRRRLPGLGRHRSIGLGCMSWDSNFKLCALMNFAIHLNCAIVQINALFNNC